MTRPMRTMNVSPTNEVAKMPMIGNGNSQGISKFGTPMKRDSTFNDYVQSPNLLAHKSLTQGKPYMPLSIYPQ